METITLLWQRIEQWLATHAPQILGELPAGASEEDFAAVAEVEAKLGFTLPEDFKASYRLHNGWPAALEFSPMTDIYPLKRIVEGWMQLAPHQDPGKWPSKGTAEYDPKIRLMRWHAGWIPFAENTGRQNWCLDLAPAEGGQVGQVIWFDHTAGGPTHVVAPRFEVLLSQFADELEVREALIFADGHLEWLQPGDRDQAYRYDADQPSPGKPLLDRAVQMEFRREHLDEMRDLYQQVLGMEHASAVDRFRAYDDLFAIFRGQGQRAEAERLLVAFAAESAAMPTDHWVYDFLEQKRSSVSAPRQQLTFVQTLIAEGKRFGAFLALSSDFFKDKQWYTTDERLEVYSLLLDLGFQLRQSGEHPFQLEDLQTLLTEFAVEAEKRPPEDPIHETVRDWTARLQQSGQAL